jgi:DNA-3-methyladenine glycosylase II
VDLPFDPKLAIRTLKLADPDLADVIRRCGPFTLQPEKMQRPFEVLLRAIVYQQLSGKAAATILGRVLEHFPKRRDFTPTAVLATPDVAFRAAGLSNAKVAAVKDLAAKTLDGTVPTLGRLVKMSDEEIVSRLVQVRGIGVWSVEMLLMFRLGRPDVLPVSDLGVRKGAMLTYGLGKMPTPKELLQHGERWRPFRSVAAWYMWRAVDLAKDAKSTRKPALPK